MLSKSPEDERINVFVEEGIYLMRSSSVILAKVEVLIYIIAAVLLSATAFIIFGYATYEFITDLVSGEVINGVITYLAHLLLALMSVELMYTVMVSIETRSLQPEPILIVGLVAAIRRILTLSVEAANLINVDIEHFKLALYEIGLLTVAIFVMVLSIFILRKSRNKALQ